MIKELMHGPIFLVEKSGIAMKDDCIVFLSLGETNDYFEEIIL